MAGLVAGSARSRMTHNRHLPGNHFTEPLPMSGTIQQTEKLKLEKYNTSNTPDALDFSMQIR